MSSSIVPLALIVAAGVSLAACGGGSGDDGGASPATGNGDPAVESTGDPETAVALESRGDERRTLMIASAVEHDLAFGGERTRESTTARFEAHVSLAPDGDDVVVEILPVAIDFTPADEAPGDGELRSRVQRFDSRGTPRVPDASGNPGAEEASALFDASTFGAFALPPLVLPVPVAAVGPGARWRLPGGEPDGPRIDTVVELVALDEAEVVTRTTSELLEPYGALLVSSGTIEATYARFSLLMKRAEITHELGYGDTLSIDGAPVEASGTILTSRTVTEASR